MKTKLIKTESVEEANELMESGYKLFSTETLESSYPRSFAGYDGKATTGQIKTTKIVYILFKE